MFLDVKKFDVAKADEAVSQLARFIETFEKKHIAKLSGISYPPDRIGLVLLYDEEPGPIITSVSPKDGDTVPISNPVIMTFDEAITDTAAEFAAHLKVWREGTQVGLAASNVTIDGKIVVLTDILTWADQYYSLVIINPEAASGPMKNPRVLTFKTEA